LGPLIRWSKTVPCSKVAFCLHEGEERYPFVVKN
jgi:hypothetical protein